MKSLDGPCQNRPASTPEPLLGAHFSISGGYCQAVNTAVSYGCRTLQIFTKNAATWKEREPTPAEAEAFRRAAAGAGIRVKASHTSYLINLASPDRAKFRASFSALEKEMARAETLGLSYVILHPGSHMGEGEKEGGKRIAGGINQVFSRVPGAEVRLLLETTAGQGTALGRSFEELAAILEQIEDQDRMGVCLDTCHIFAAGYDIRTAAGCRDVLDRLDRILGLSRLHVIHLNDARKGLGSRVDRHAHIGAGKIGIPAFRVIMNDLRLQEVPKIIETPKGDGKAGVDWDRVNLCRLRSLVETPP